MTSGQTTRDQDYQSTTLPRRTFERSIFDNHLVRLSDRGGASQRIGAAWSDVCARVLEAWVDRCVPADREALRGGRIETVHRLDTLPGVAARASSAGLKNPDFVLFGAIDGRSIIFGADAKFSVETARPVQVSAETIARLFTADVHLSALLPEPAPGAAFEDGLFLSPDYILTHRMFQHKNGHRRLTVSPEDVVLAEVDAWDLFAGVASVAVIERLVEMDRLPFPVWGSLLAAQYYFRLERAIVGIVGEEQRPLLGVVDIDATEVDLLDRLVERATSDGAWQMIVEWDLEIEHLRRQRQALSQVVGSPLSGAELRDLSDAVMDEMRLEDRPSRNRIRKALGARFSSDVLERVGVIMPPVEDFPAELERVGDVARDVADGYVADIREILGDIIRRLVDDSR